MLLGTGENPDGSTHDLNKRENNTPIEQWDMCFKVPRRATFPAIEAEFSLPGMRLDVDYHHFTEKKTSKCDWRDARPAGVPRYVRRHCAPYRRGILGRRYLIRRHR